MLLRVVRGKVSVGRESDFVAVCRQLVADFGRASGLAAFICGYRRVDGVDEFVLGSTWESDELATSVAGTADNPIIAARLGGIATIDTLDVYDVLEPAFRGTVDAPGGVVRLTVGKVANENRARMLSWLKHPRGERAKDIEHSLLGWAVGERPTDNGAGVEVVSLSAWPSPLVVEAIGDRDRSIAPLYEEIDEFAGDFRVDVYRALGLELQDAMADPGSRRIIAARFAARQAADDAALGLTAAVAHPREAQISVAPLGAPGQAANDGSYVLVARVDINEFGRAERLIGDQGGEVILAQRETTQESESQDAPDAPVATSALSTGFLPAK